MRPHFFPSVPRLFNRIYSKISAGLNEAQGCKKWLIDMGLDSKAYYYHRDCAYTHRVYDAMVFSKIQAMLGGRVRTMVSGSAPIEKNVL